MSATSFSQARNDDTQQRLLYKIAVALFSAGSFAPALQPQLDDTRFRLTWKIVSMIWPASGDPSFQPRMDDISWQALLWKWASLLWTPANSSWLRPNQIDTEQMLLRKIAAFYSPGQSEDFQCCDPGNQQRLLYYIAVALQSGVIPVPPTPPVPPVPPAPPFEWFPHTALATWSDSGGNKGPADYPTFLATADLPTVISVNLVHQGITAINNVRSLPQLNTLQCDQNPLTSLDVSGSGNLFDVECSLCQITALNTSNCPGLGVIVCSNNNALASLDLTSDPSLGYLDCSLCALTALSVIANPLLNFLNCSLNSNLTALDCTGLAALQTLTCTNCNLTGPTGLLLGGCTALQTLDCSNNVILTGLDLTNLSSLVTLTATNLGGTTITWTGCTALTSVTISGSFITSVTGTASLTSLQSFSGVGGNCTPGYDFSGLLNLTTVNVDSIELPSVTCVGCTALTSFTCINCAPSSNLDINLTGCSALTICYAYNNLPDTGIGTLTLTGCPALQTLLINDSDCFGAVDLSPFQSVISVLVLNNAYPGFSLTGFSNLTLFDIYSSLVATLDFTQTPLLQELHVRNSILTSVDLSSCVHMVSIDATNSVGLTSLILGGSTHYNNVLSGNCLLPASPNGVDGVLNVLATNCLTNVGTCDLNTPAMNASPTGGALNADYVALTGAGWTVSIN